MSFFDPAVAAAKAKDAELTADQSIPPLNPRFPYPMQAVDPLDFDVLKDPPKIDKASQPT